MQLKDLLKPYQLELLQRLQTPTVVLQHPRGFGKTVNTQYGKKPIPEPSQPTVTVKKHRHPVKEISHEQVR